MKAIKLLVASIGLACFSAQAQSADEIINGYIETTRGAENYASLQGVKMKAAVKQGGFEMPLEVVNLKDGRQYVKIDFQGKNIFQNVFDGEVFWSTNFQTMKAEKADAEMQKILKEQTKDFPDALFEYKKKGYTAELMGTETLDGAETYKVKLTKSPITIEGKEVPQVTYYFFDTENYVLIGQETEVMLGPQKGAVSRTLYSDYQEVEGLYFPFSISQGVKGMPLQPMVISAIELNPEVDESIFKYPAQ